MRLTDPAESNRSTRLLGLVALLVFLALMNRFIQDDAFISFQYARNLAEGNGLTFNPGERVEGYTNFLWTLLISAGISVGLDPVVWSYVLGLSFFAGSLIVTYRLTTELSGVAGAGLLACGLLGSNFTFNAYATGGLETQMQAFLVVLGVSLSRRATQASGPTILLPAAASTVYGLAVLTRLDSVVCLLLPGLLVLAHLLRNADGHGLRAARVAALCVPATLLVAPWLAWKLSYYGDVLPNTFYVKVSSAASLVRGGHYVYRFFATYWLLPLAAFALVARPGRVIAVLRRGRPPWGPTLVATVLLWCAYVAFVGGDFMEFRFMVPILPIVMALLSWCLVEVVEDRRARAAAVAVVLLGSVLHAATFWGVRDIESIRSLAIHMEPDGGDWDEVGRTLAEHFEPGGEVVIAVGPAGEIPYYSRLRTVDMRGLIDPWVARNGIIVSTVPGHQRMSPLSYLVEREVNLVVGHPQVVSRDDGLPAVYPLADLSRFALADASPETLPAGSRIVAIPMSGDRLLLALYLTEDGAVDRAIAENRWLTVPIGDAAGRSSAGGRP